MIVSTLSRRIPNQKPGIRKEVEYGVQMTRELADFIRSEGGKQAQRIVFETLASSAKEQNWIKWTDGIDFVHKNKLDLQSLVVDRAIYALLSFGLIEIHNMWVSGMGRRRGSFSQHIKITAKGFERWNSSLPQKS